MSPSSADVTELLVAWSDGDKSAEKELFSLVYGELRHLAHRYMLRENPGNTLQTTALVNEAYVRLIDSKRANWQNRAHFFGFSAQVMRHLLVDLARSKNFQKRGGEVRKERPPRRNEDTDARPSGRTIGEAKLRQEAGEMSDRAKGAQ